MIGVKRRAVVINVDDPENYGRLTARLIGFGETDNDTQHNETPWMWPCVAFAVDGAGVFMMPPVGAEVWAEQTAEKDWVWTGCFWSGRNQLPASASAPGVRIIRTPSGHQIKLDEDGDIEIMHANGNFVALRSNGDIDVTVSGNANVTATGKVVVDGSNIELNGTLGGVVRTCDICSYTGGPHVKGSITVKAGG